jgi:integrase
VAGNPELCKLTGVEYKSSHKLRKGHGVNAVENSENYQDFQAYSQNMGHEDPGTTYKYYSKLSNDAVRAVILRKK